MCVCLCVCIYWTAFFVSQSRGNVVQIFSTDIICEKICSELAGFGEGGTGSACFQSKSISLFMPSVLQPSNTPVRSRALCANDGQTLRGKKKNQTMQVSKDFQKKILEPGRQSQKGTKSFYSSLLQGRSAGRELQPPAPQAGGAAAGPRCLWKSFPLNSFGSQSSAHKY